MPPSAVMRVAAVLLLSVLLSSSHPPAARTHFTLGESSPVERTIRKMLAQRAAAGDRDAEYQLLTIQMFSERPTNIGAYRTELEGLAGRGHAGAASLLAGAYRNGRGVPQDFDEGARWLARAAELGDENAGRDLAAYQAYTAR